MSTLPTFLSGREAAQMFGVSKSFWYDLTARGGIPVVMVGKRMKYNLQDLLEHFKSRPLRTR